MSEFYDTLDEEIEEQSQDDKRLAYISKYRREFVLCPAFIKTKDDLPNLEWNTIKFNTETPNLPDQQGVYAFSINVDNGNLPSNSYILYIGKAGDITSKNTIKKRYRDYVREARVQSRPKIHRMLNLWSEHLTYHYAEVPNGVSTGDIEKQLTTIFIPPYNTNDFVVEVRDLLKGTSIL
ncbi:hypothetical protein ITG10_02905 [Vibrio sp. ED004]|uniref:hypothetical protein n=1 Tax=Vibrio sp. ED004 TaxID=2785124 RepID=UPI002055544F|nr:hypothetical protein [Vibrio sp. ED004]UPR57314.1 hypothetical protein ITG10_02905 [Vibrio sp. ED004]